MTMEELIKLLMQHSDEYAVESYEDIIVGTRPARKHKKKRIQKKWLKKYGLKPIIERKKCKKIDVTLNMIIEFCRDYNYPLPDEIIGQVNKQEV